MPNFIDWSKVNDILDNQTNITLTTVGNKVEFSSNWLGREVTPNEFIIMYNRDPEHYKELYNDDNTWTITHISGSRAIKITDELYLEINEDKIIKYIRENGENPQCLRGGVWNRKLPEVLESKMLIALNLWREDQYKKSIEQYQHYLLKGVPYNERKRLKYDLERKRKYNIYAGREKTYKFKVLDFHDVELGKAYNKQEAIQIFKERYKYSSDIDAEPFIYQI